MFAVAVQEVRELVIILQISKKLAHVSAARRGGGGMIIHRWELFGFCTLDNTALPPYL